MIATLPHQGTADDHAQHLADGAAGQAMQRGTECRAIERGAMFCVHETTAGRPATTMSVGDVLPGDVRGAAMNRFEQGAASLPGLSLAMGVCTAQALEAAGIRDLVWNGRMTLSTTGASWPSPLNTIRNPGRRRRTVLRSGDALRLKPGTTCSPSSPPCGATAKLRAGSPTPSG